MCRFWFYFAAFSLETSQREIRFRWFSMCHLVKYLAIESTALVWHLSGLMKSASLLFCLSLKKRCLKLMQRGQALIIDYSTFLGLVLLQNILEVVEELILVDPPLVSEHMRKNIEQKTHFPSCSNKQTNKFMRRAHPIAKGQPFQVDGFI